MKIKVKRITITLMVILVMLSACKGPSSEQPKESAVPSEYTITVLNPQGHVKKDKVLAPRLDTLEGKKIAMWLNSTPDQLYAGKGAELYDLLEDSLKEKYSNIEIVRYTELPMKYSPQDEVVDTIVKTQPDAVLAGFGG